MTRCYSLAVLACAAATQLLTAAAEASVAITIQQVGADVVATGSGSIAINNLDYTLSGGASGGYVASEYYLFGSINDVPFVGYAVRGPTLLEDNQPISPYAIQTDNPVAALGFGDKLGLFHTSDSDVWELQVSEDYKPNSSLSFSNTWANSTLAGLAFRPGSYVWNLGSGESAETITINVLGGSGVPEPSAWATMIAGISVAGLAMRRRKVAVRFA
jgi:hypothetical protein